MSSKNAIYESSILCFFGADDELTNSGFPTIGAVGRDGAAVVDGEGFGLDFGAASSLLTLTDAGT